jgi:hypothetical protein
LIVATEHEVRDPAAHGRSRGLAPADGQLFAHCNRIGRRAGTRTEKNRQQIRLAVKYRILSLKHASLWKPA